MIIVAILLVFACVHDTSEWWLANVVLVFVVVVYSTYIQMCKHWRIKGAALRIVFNISLLQLTCRQYLHWNLGSVDCRSVKMKFFLLQRLQRHSKAPCLRLAFLPDSSVHVTVACFTEEWSIACMFACKSKGDQHTEEVGFCFSAFPCQHSGAPDFPAEALGWAS